jgi:putative ABC transport system permease protein
MGLRLALGADRRRLVRQMLTESTILAVAGGVLGIWLAWMGVEWLVRLGEGNIPRLDETRVDPVVIGFSVGVSLLTGLVVGLIPALQQSQTNLRTSLGEDARGGSDSVRRRRLRTSLAVAQIAMALVLLVGAGLLSRTFVELQRVDTGFTPDRVLAMDLSLPRFQYATDTSIAGFFQRLNHRIAAIPGAEEVGGVYPLPMSGEGWSGSYTVEGEPIGPGLPLPHAEYSVVIPGYFRAMHIEVLAGREFTAQDTAGARRVTIVDERLAATHWPNQSALERRIDVSGGLATIVGVVRHVHRGGPRVEGEPQVYQPHAQIPEASMTIVIRTTGRPADVVASLRQEVRTLDPNLPISRLRGMDEVVASALSRERFSLVLLAAFALAALGLASVGLYGLMAYLVSQRTREIGIRMALGGQPSDVRWMVARESLFISFSGLALGSVISLALSRLVDHLLYGVSPTDATTYVGVALLMTLVAVAATYGPASRATRVDPVVALRD